MRWVFALAVDDLIVGDVLVLSLERGGARSQLVHQDSQSPNVHTFVVFIPLYDFGRDIVDSSAESLPLAA